MSTDEYLELYTNSIKGCDNQGYENFEKPKSNTIPDEKSTKSYPVDAVDQQNEYEEIPDPTEGYEPLRRPKDDKVLREPTTQPESHSGCRKPPLFWCILTLVLFVVVVVLVVTLVTGK